ncbi:laccase [Lasiosphaeris hirsuta]|uniref:Laccase n=1 Tax=Lasiosphaeris hirsuta TaxID=260670 RepID=A0AA40E2F7_9PEZI|nr:laccase [Lasiosphaeris hirsuta]
MKGSIFSALALVVGSLATTIPHRAHKTSLYPRQSSNSSCEHGPKSRKCWGDYSIDTDWYQETPPGKLEERWLSIEEGPCSPDGYERHCMTFNGTIPGPTIIANWGDELVIHVTNNMKNNGTAVHWHGVRQLGSLLADGVPGVTQCPIAPGETMTYRFNVTQYGSAWYHSHFSLQYSEGLFGGIVFKGPATADYDVDLGNLFLQDWSHIESFAVWEKSVKKGFPPSLDTGLINGTNTKACSETIDPKCAAAGPGKKFETIFESGTKYLLRLVNSAADGVFQFSIDGHNLTVIANDFVPIEPYVTDSVQLTVGQRYDVIVEANAEPGNYWLRSGWLAGCALNMNPTSMTGIVRYKADTADPETTSTVVPSGHCLDEPFEKTVPHLKLDAAAPSITYEQLNFNTSGGLWKWTLNSSSLKLDWKNPTMKTIFDGKSVFPTEYNVVGVDRTAGTNTSQWAALVIQDTASAGPDHPIHLHGHDFWVLDRSSGKGTFDFANTKFNLKNPTRRDVATLPNGGYLVIAFKLDNPGAWLVHCHIAWHASQGLSLEFVEDQSLISIGQEAKTDFDNTCKSWSLFTPIWEQDDSGI